MDPNLHPGQRIRLYRERAGMSRTILGELVGRTGDWVKKVENGRLLPPRLPMLLRLAEVLHVDDLADLTGGPRLPMASFSRATHESLRDVADALTDYPISVPDPTPAAELTTRVRQAWDLWHGTRTHRTAVAVVLPGLIHDAQVAARRLDGNDRRDALRALAQVYHLAQLYLSYQPTPELLFLTGDRAMTAAQDADDPYAIAAAAWYMNHIFRDAGDREAARVDLATRAAGLLRPDRGGEDLARWGLLQLAVALSHAKSGREGEAWRYWDQAERAATALGRGYAHPWLIFGRGMVNAYAITIHADLTHGWRAVQQAKRVDFSTMPSLTRRSFHLAEVARAEYLRGEHAGAVHLLQQACTESPDTTRFSLFARGAVLELTKRNDAKVGPQVQTLAERLGIAV